MAVYAKALKWTLVLACAALAIGCRPLPYYIEIFQYTDQATAHFRATSIFDELEMDNELRFAQGQAARERQGAVVIPNLPLRGPNITIEENVRGE